jgi:serine/threonine-protein phosphatase PGAM5
MLKLFKSNDTHLFTGREQANATGRRLKELGMPYGAIIHSPLDRAVETAQIIHKHLSDVPVHVDDILQEGGPVPPEPTITYWGLPERVCLHFILHLC